MRFLTVTRTEPLAIKQMADRGIGVPALKFTCENSLTSGSRASWEKSAWKPIGDDISSGMIAGLPLLNRRPCVNCDAAIVTLLRRRSRREGGCLDMTTAEFSKTGWPGQSSASLSNSPRLSY